MMSKNQSIKFMKLMLLYGNYILIVSVVLFSLLLNGVLK